jgi:hypothetical protein
VCVSFCSPLSLSLSLSLQSAKLLLLRSK